jgi:hypothetical protein
MKNNNESWEENIYEFYKVKNKFTQSSDLIHRVVTKIGRDVVTPLQNNYDKLKEDNALLLNALKGLYEFNLGKPDYLDTLLNNAESAILKAESKS